MVDRRPFALVAMLVALLAGCPRAKKAGSANAASPENQSTLAKLDAYVTGCLDHSERIFQIGDRYVARYAAARPAKTTVPVSPDPADCVAQIERVRTAAPASPRSATSMPPPRCSIASTA